MRSAWASRAVPKHHYWGRRSPAGEPGSRAPSRTGWQRSHSSSLGAPEAGNLFFELMSAASVWLFWLTLRKPFGEAAAAFAAGLMALSPWSALFGDRVWNPNAFLFFEGLALLAAVKLREHPRSAWAAVLLVACLALPQLHSSAPVVWLALLPLVVGPLRQARRRTLAIGIALGALLYIPLLIHEAKTGSVTRARSSPRRSPSVGGRTRPSTASASCSHPFTCSGS